MKYWNDKVPRLVELPCGWTWNLWVLQKRFHAIVVFHSPSYYWAVLKNRYFRPWVRKQPFSTGNYNKVPFSKGFSNWNYNYDVLQVFSVRQLYSTKYKSAQFCLFSVI